MTTWRSSGAWRIAMAMRHLRNRGFAAAFMAMTAVGSSAMAQDVKGWPAPGLTPVGAELGANADGTIPAWEGGLVRPPRAWTPDRSYLDPFPSDQPIARINTANLDAWRSKLSPGTQALLAASPDYYLPLFATRRTAVLPDAVVAAARKEAPGIAVSGDSLTGRTVSTIPFPQPKTGSEVMWNHRLRYRGGSGEHDEVWYPVRDHRIVQRVAYNERHVENIGLSTPTAAGIIFVRAAFSAPPTMAGTRVFVHETIDASEDSRNWWVETAQKRVRRLTTPGYDDVPDGTDALRTRDQHDAFAGPLNRYDWKLVGKQELVVPYNTYDLFDKRLRAEHVFGAHSIKPDFMRFELHRVWVVEATLKPGMRHLYGKRVFYIDEDSWSVLVEDVYDGRGKLWRVALHGLVQYYDAMVPWYAVNIWHDLSNGAYLVGGVDFETPTRRRFGITNRLADFQPGTATTKEETK